VIDRRTNSEKLAPLMNLLPVQKTKLTAEKGAVRRWVVFDADGQVLGRLAGRIVHHLRGKHRADFSPHQENGDYVVVVNAGKVKVTGGKGEKKIYHTHSGFTGGMKSTLLKDSLARRPAYPLEMAVKRMLPRGRLGRQLYRNLHIYGGSTHPHQSQKPVAAEV